MAKKQDVLGGLSGLLSTPTPKQEPTAKPQEPVQVEEPTPTGARQLKSPRGTTIRVCYNLNAEIVAKAKAIAYYDRKNINEIFNEALQAYIDGWKPTPQEPPKF